MAWLSPADDSGGLEGAGWGAHACGGSGGDIITLDQFEDFELALQWKLAPGGNTGIFYRVTEDDDAMWKTAPEMQLLDDAAHKDVLTPETSSGANYALHAPTRDVGRLPGSWNEARVLVKGNHVEHWLNRVKIVEYELASDDWQRRVLASKFKDHPRYGRARRGHIGLQDYDGKNVFRNIRIRELK